MSDLIDRQAVLELPRNVTRNLFGDIVEQSINVERIKALPSAQPELCEDAVSRQRLLSDLKELIAAWKKYPVMAEQIKGVETAIGYVKVIPSVKPDSKELSSIHKALDTISRQAAIDAVHKNYDTILDFKSDGCTMASSFEDIINDLPSAESEHKNGERMSNREWVDFLSEQFNVSRTSAREMLHGLMKWKAEDNFKKQYSRGGNEKE